MRTKYVEIVRDSGLFKNSYTSLRAAEDALKRGLISEYKPVTLKQIKERRLHHYREDDYFRHQAEEQFYTQYNGKKFKAKVIDGGMRSKMLVQIIGAEELHLRTIFACNINGKKTWYPETACVYYETGQEVNVELKVYHGFELFVIGLTPGHLDEARWNQLKNKDLAFRCDEDGNAITGLFK